MNYSKSISLECPHCNTKCQFIQKTHSFCKSDQKHHITYECTNCWWEIITKWESSISNIISFENHPTWYSQTLNKYYPIIWDYKSRVNLSIIPNTDVKEDFIEAIWCYNNWFYNSCMMMARRAIQQEMLLKWAKWDNLYKQIESIWISEKLKALLHKIKNFWNSWAHPDFCLYDEGWKKIENKKEFAKLSLEFLDRYFANEYEIELLVEKAPKSELELK